MRRSNLVVTAIVTLLIGFSIPTLAQEKRADNVEILREKITANKKLLVATNTELTESYEPASDSVENMSPGHPFLRALNDLPIDPAIPAHSIIAVLGDGPITGKTDGVVAYESAHIEGVRSEKVVRSSHSTQGHPETIDEVRRILREYIGAQ